MLVARQSGKSHHSTCPVNVLMVNRNVNTRGGDKLPLLYVSNLVQVRTHAIGVR